MLGKVAVKLAGPDGIIERPIKPNVQKLRYATNCYPVVVMVQVHSGTDYTTALAGFHDGAS